MSRRVLQDLSPATMPTHRAAVLRFPAWFSTERLLLRQWRTADMGHLAAMNADPRVMGSRPTLTPYQSATAMDRWRDRINEYGWGLWAVERRDTCAWIGMAGLHVPTERLPFLPCVELVVRLAHSQWGKGFASEAAKTTLDAGFTHLLLEEIVACTEVRDHRSRRLMQRIGMREDDAAFQLSSSSGDGSPSPQCLYRISRPVRRTVIEQA